MKRNLKWTVVALAVMGLGLSTRAYAMTSSESLVEGQLLNISSCIRESQSQVLLTAVNNVIGLGYVRSAIVQAIQENGRSEDSALCYTGIALKKNIFQHYQFLISMQVKSLKRKTITHEFHLLYQDASTQANHNIGEKPWVGLSKSAVASVFAAGLSDLNWEKSQLNTESGFDFNRALQESTNFRKNFKNGPPASLGVFRLDGMKSNLYLATWMIATGENVFAASEIPEGFVLNFDSVQDQVLRSDLSWIQARILFPLEEKIQQDLRSLPYQAYAAKLLEYSKQ